MGGVWYGFGKAKMAFRSKHGGMNMQHELSLILLSNLEQQPWELEVSVGLELVFCC